jgi:branched-chain amino acid transport system substrate-binding protein
MKRGLTRKDFLRAGGGALAGAYALGLAGCALQSGGGGGNGGGGGPIKIGHIAPRSGFLGTVGAESAEAAQFAVDEINADGGIDGRKLELLDEDTPEPGAAVQKVTRLINRDRVDVLVGEISSASGLAVADIAQRSKKVYVNTGWNSDEGRTTKCNPYLFHVEGSNTMYVGSVAQYFRKQASERQGNSVYFITSDYAYGQDLLRVSKKLMDELGAEVVGSDFAPTGSTDYSSYITGMQQKKPDFVWSNLAGEDITTFLKQYTGEFGSPFPVLGAGMDEAQAWAVGKSMTGVWPGTYYYTIDTPQNKDFVERWEADHKFHPTNQNWQTYTGVKILAQAMKEAGSTEADALVEYMAGGATFDVGKEEPVSFDENNHQLIMGMYALQAKDQIDNVHQPFNIIQTVSGEDLRIPKSEIECSVSI